MKTFQLSSCPVPVVVNDDEIIDCNAEIATEISVDEEGAEYGVWATSIKRSACGHTDSQIEKAMQYRILGIDW